MISKSLLLGVIENGHLSHRHSNNVAFQNNVDKIICVIYLTYVEVSSRTYKLLRKIVIRSHLVAQDLGLLFVQHNNCTECGSIFFICNSIKRDTWVRVWVSRSENLPLAMGT